MQYAKQKNYKQTLNWLVAKTGIFKTEEDTYQRSLFMNNTLIGFDGKIDEQVI